MCSSNVGPRVRGAIFKLYDDACPYYKAYQCGGTMHKASAHVYTCDEIRQYQLRNHTWSTKRQGRWTLVYE